MSNYCVTLNIILKQNIEAQDKNEAIDIAKDNISSLEYVGNVEECDVETVVKGGSPYET